MIHAMELRRFSPRTQESYLAAVAGLAKHYRQPPDQLDATKIQAYLLHSAVFPGVPVTSLFRVCGSSISRLWDGMD
jgi:hypothetical protein